MKKQIFIRFLKEKNALFDFKTHIGNWDGRPIGQSFRSINFYQLVHELPPDKWINFAFAWENSKLGSSRWLYLSDEWAILLSKTKRIKK